jgi:hypothetical protein
MKPVILIAMAATLTWSGPLAAEENKSKAQSTFEVPYRLTDTFHVLVRAKLNGKGPYSFIIDTGAPAMFIATNIAKQIGIRADANGWGKLDRLEIEGGVVLTDASARIETPFQLEGMNGLGLAGTTVHGMIGYNILARYRIEFDFTRDKLRWTRLAYVPPPPFGLGGKVAAPAGLDALASIMKFVGAFVGKRPTPKLSPRGFLGIQLADRDGAVIDSVLKESAAAQAGLKPQDRIEAANGEEISSPADFLKEQDKLEPGQSMDLRVVREGKTIKVRVKLGEGF